MATPIYRNCLKQFWKKMENVDVTLSTGSNDTWSGNIQRYTANSGSTPGIADHYFWQAGQALIRVLQSLTYDEVYKISSTLLGVETVTLASGTGTISNANVAYVYDRLVCYTNGSSSSYDIACMLDTWERDEIVNNLNPRKTPSATQRFFEVSGSTINVYPTTYNRITVRFLKSCPLQVSGNDQFDIFPENLSDIWTDMACQIAAGDIKDSMEVMITKRLQEKFTFLAKPKQRTPNNREIVK